MAISRWKLVELAVFFAERSLEDATNVSIEHDAKLPDRLTGALRQVDVAIRYSQGGRGYLRTVEVQHRGKKIGPEFIDSMVSKADRVGAHRTTLVSAAGFTKAAADRLAEHPSLFDAVLVRPLRFADRPDVFRSPGGHLVVEQSTRQIIKATTPEYWEYRRLSDDVVRHIEISDSSFAGTTAAQALIIDPGAIRDDGMVDAVHQVLVKPGSKAKLSSFGTSQFQSDGWHHTVVSMGAEPTSLPLVEFPEPLPPAP